jgi:hypothetical protein
MSGRDFPESVARPALSPRPFPALGHGWVDPYERCIACFDPCRPGWRYCDKCHAYSDPASPIGRAYFARQHKQRREPLESTLRKIMRRLTAIERGAIPALSARMDAVEDAWSLRC